MPTPLTLSLPDDLLARLRERATAAGTTPEAVAADCLAESPRLRAGGGLRRLAGSLPVGDGGVADRIDQLIGDELVDQLRRADVEVVRPAART